MNFKPCLLIPIYNHGYCIRATVKHLLPFERTIFIVDDGSDALTRAELVALADELPQVRLLRLPVNSGKGAAVMHGMRAAYQQGFTHALQIDADGQHDAKDVPRFFEAGASQPDSVICGQPVYDESVPKARLYGRYITHFWVWVETLSFAIGDSMCGFRLYPLAATCAMIERAAIPTRMDFDTAIAVKLAWAGLSFQNIPTRVTYPENGVSHFDMWRDNLRITRMHSRLCFGMLARLPRLLWRKVVATGQHGPHWSQLTERGSALGLRIVYTCYRLLGEHCASLLLSPIVLYFFLTSARSRKASHDYLCRIAQRQGTAAPNWRDSFRHQRAFAQSGLDKLAAWMGGIDPSRIDFPDRAIFDELLASGRGAVLIGSHLGNLEMTRALATSQQLATINAVVYTEHAPQFNRLLATVNADFGVKLLQVNHFGPETAIMLKDKTSQGELLVIVGDRTPPAENGRVSHVDFLGAPAAFAQGPFILASLLDCPVFLFFCLRQGKRYRIYFEPFAERIELPRHERAQHLHDYLQRYAERLEAHCLLSPEQWFNFYDFWHHGNATSRPKA